MIKLKHVWHFSENGERKKLIVVLHGRGDSPEGYEWMPGALAIPELNYLLLQAPDPYFEEGYSWYDMPPNQLTGVVRSRKLLEEVFVELEKNGYAPENCFLFGFSQGSLMTLEFGSRYPKKLVGYIGISGYCLSTETLLKEASTDIIQNGNWLITHGTDDDVLPIDRTRKQMKNLMNAGFKMDYREYDKVHTIDPEIELPYIREWIKKKIT